MTQNKINKLKLPTFEILIRVFLTIVFLYLVAAQASSLLFLDHASEQFGWSWMFFLLGNELVILPLFLLLLALRYLIRKFSLEYKVIQLKTWYVLIGIAILSGFFFRFAY